jgi:hypothetical protein
MGCVVFGVLRVIVSQKDASNYEFAFGFLPS